MFFLFKMKKPQCQTFGAAKALWPLSIGLIGPTLDEFKSQGLVLLQVKTPYESKILAEKASFRR